MLLFHTTNRTLAKKRLQAINKTEFTDRIIKSISIEDLANEIVPKLASVKKRTPDPIDTLSQGFDVVVGMNGKHYFNKKRRQHKK
jgi:hypothetical protein